MFGALVSGPRQPVANQGFFAMLRGFWQFISFLKSMERRA